MAKIRVDEKRLEELKRQLYGKEKISLPQKHNGVKISTVTLPSPKVHVATQDLGYLKRDLTKIFILSGFAIGFQLILYFLSLKNLINLNIHF